MHQSNDISVAHDIGLSAEEPRIFLTWQGGVPSCQRHRTRAARGTHVKLPHARHMQPGGAVVGKDVLHRARSCPRLRPIEPESLHRSFHRDRQSVRASFRWVRLHPRSHPPPEEPVLFPRSTLFRRLLQCWTQQYAAGRISKNPLGY